MGGATIGVYSALEAGAIIGYRQAIGQLDEGMLEASIALQGPMSEGWDGLSMALNMEYSWAVNFMWRMAVDGALTLVDNDYAMSRFGVSSTDAELPGLSAFDANGGLNDATVSLRSIVSFSPAWGVFTRLAYTRLLQDATDSPIVAEAGALDQWFVGLGVFRNLSE